MANDAEMRFKATLEDDTTPQLDKLEKKLRQMGASPAEIKMVLNAVDQASPKISDVQKLMAKMPKEQVLTIKANADDAMSKIGALQQTADQQPIHLKFLDNIDEVGSRLFNLRSKISLPIGGVLGGTGLGQLYGVGAAGAGAGAIGAAGIGLMQQGVSYNSQMEQSMVTLTQTLKDQSKAQQEMGQLVSFAQKTPFQYQDVMAADVRLRSYQIPTMKGEGGPGNKGWLSSAGDMAAAMGTPITQAVEAIADARQGYFVRMMSYGIRMMREDFQAGGKYAGLSYEQGIERATRRFEGSMQMQSKTLAGTVSNLKDIFQQQILGPIGKVPFDAIKGVAQQAYSSLSDPKTLEKLGLIMQNVQERQTRLFNTVKQGKALFEAHMQIPLENILKDVVKLGTIFGQAFGGTTGAVLKTVGSALLGISGVVTNVAAQVPGFTQFYGILKAMSMLGFNSISDPFLNLMKSVNPLTFSLKGMLASLIQIPGALAKLGIAMIVKHFIDAHEATKAFNSEFKNMSDMSLDKLNLQVDGLSMRLGTAAYEMKNLATYSQKAFEDAGLKGIGTGPNGAQLALNSAANATMMQQQFGFDPMQAISMMSETFKQTGTAVSQGSEDRFYQVLKQSTIGIQELGGSAQDVVTIFSEFKDSAAKIGLTGPGFTDEVFGLRSSLTNRMTAPQIGQFKSPDAMIQQMFSATAAPSADMINAITGDGKHMGALNKYFSARNIRDLPSKANTIPDDHYAALEAYNKGDISRHRYMRFLAGGAAAPPDWYAKAGKGPDRVSRGLDFQYGMDLTSSTYLANERAKQQAAAAISTIAPTVDISKIQPQNPFLENKMGINAGPIKDMQNNMSQVQAIGSAWLNASKNLDGLNAKIEAWQENITKTTGKQINYQNALDMVNSQMSAFQYKMTQANRVVEDASLALQKYQLANVMPLQMHMETLNNEIAKVGNNLQNAQYQLGKYSEGLISGEQAELNRLHNLDRYNKQLQLLQLTYTQMGAELGSQTYERGFSSRVEPIAGLSLQMQMDKLQRKQQMEQLRYDLSYGEQHYKIEQAGRSKFQKMEMPFQQRLQGVKDNTEATDKYTAAQHRLGNQQFDLSQQMYKVNREVERQQNGITALQISVQEMQQSPAFRGLQDEQMQLQMHLDATNRKLNLQNQNLTQWQNLMDDLKDEVKGSGDIFSALTGSKGSDAEQKIKSMVNMWAKLPKSMGGITEAQRTEIMKTLAISETAQKAQRDKSLDSYMSWWEKVKNITTQGFIGLFTGQTWGLIGQAIRTSVAGLFQSLGIPGGDLLGGGISGAITLGGTAYAMFTGGRLAANAGRYATLTTGAALARQLPGEGKIASGLGRGFSAVGGAFSEGSGIGGWFTQHGATLEKDSSLLSAWLKSLRPEFMDSFRIIKSFRTMLGGGIGAMAGGILGGPIGGWAGGLVGAGYGQQPFRKWPIIGRPLSSFRGGGLAADALGGAEGAVRATVEVAPSIKFVSAAMDKAAGGLGMLQKILEFSGLGALLKGAGGFMRLAGKAAVVTIPIFAALDLKTLITGKGDQKAAIGGLAGLGAGAAIGGSLGLLGGPLAPLTVPGGAIAGAAIGQSVGPMLAKMDWGKIFSSLPHLIGKAISWQLHNLGLLIGATAAIIFKGPQFILHRGMNLIGDLLSSFFHMIFTTSTGGLKKAGSALPTLIWGFISNIPEMFWYSLVRAKAQLPIILFRFVKNIPDMIASAFDSIAKMVADGIKGLPQKVADWMAGKADDVWGGVKSGFGLIPGGAQTGIERVQGMPVMKLHPNEAVLNSAEAGLWRQQKAMGIGGGAAVGYQVGLSGGSAVQQGFSKIEGDWSDHLDKVQNIVKDHEDKVVGINVDANKALVGTNKKAQVHIADTIKAHNKGTENHTQQHYNKVNDKTNKGLKDTHKTVQDWSKKISGTWNAGLKDWHIPHMGMPGMPGGGKQGPLAGLTGAVHQQTLDKDQQKKMIETLRGKSRDELDRLVEKYNDLPDRLRTPAAKNIWKGALSVIGDRHMHEMQAFEDKEHEEQRKRTLAQWDWFMNKGDDQNKKLSQQQQNANKRQQDDQTKSWDVINSIFGVKLNTANTIYNAGWSVIHDTTSGWIDSVQKLIKGIDSDLGLTKGNKHHGGGAKGGDGHNHPAYAHGGLIKGVGEPKGKLIRVGEEADEVVIPLAAHRRHRAQSLINQVQGHFGGHNAIAGYANGGHTGIGSGKVAQEPFKERFQDKLLSLWHAASPYLPGSSPANMPPTTLAHLPAGMAGLMGKKVGGGGGLTGYQGAWDNSRRVFINIDKTAMGQFLKGKGSLAETITHEWAHYFQTPELLKSTDMTEKEGGAVAWTKEFLPAISKKLHAHFQFGKLTNQYKKDLRQVLATKDENWIERGQFGYANGGMIHESHPGTDTAYTTAKNAYMQARNFDNGGWVWRGVSDSGLHTGIENVTESLLKRYPGLSVTAGFATSGHSPTSLHYSGHAADISGDTKTMYAAAQWIKSSGLYKVLNEGIHNPNLSVQSGKFVPSSFWGSSTWAGHSDHIHVGVTDPVSAKMLAHLGAGISSIGGMGGANIPHVPKSLLGMGPIGKKLYHALSAKAKKWGGASASMGGLGSKVALGPIKQMAKQMVQQMFGPGEWGAFDALEMSEAGYDPNIANSSSGAYGIPQALPASKLPGVAGPNSNAPTLVKARAQLQWMMQYIKDRYGDPKAAWSWHQANNWYAGGLDRVPHDNFPAILHKDEKVVQAGEANYMRSKGGGAASVASHWEKTLQIIANIQENIKKAKEALDDIKKGQDKADARARLQALRDELAAKRRLAGAQGGKFNRGIKRLLQKAHDKSGGESTARLVAKERRKFKKMMKRAVKRAKHSKGYRSATKKIRKLKKHGVTKKERKQIQHLRQRQHKIISHAKQQARHRYLVGAAKRGVNAALIKAITGKGLSKEERKWYEKIAKDAENRHKDNKNDKASSRKEAAARRKAKEAAAAKDKVEMMKERAKKDADKVKGKAETAKRRAQQEAKREKRQSQNDGRGNKRDQRNDNYQKVSLDLLKDIARKDLSISIHNQTNGTTIDTTTSGGSSGGGKRRRRK